MGDLTLPNKWGEEGFNAIRKALIDYCGEAGTPVDLGHAFQWDTGTPLLKHSEDMTDDQYRNSDTALQVITDYMNAGCDPWQAVAKARQQWDAEKERVRKEVLPDLDQDKRH